MKASAAGDRSWQAEDDYDHCDHPKVPISDVGTEELPHVATIDSATAVAMIFF